MIMVYIGTYTHGKSKGIYNGRLDLATGKLTIDGVTPTVDPSFLAIDPSRRFLYAVNETDHFEGKKGGGVSAFAIDPKSGALTALDRQSSEGTAPCDISVDAGSKNVFVANYGSGNVAVLPIAKDGRVGKATCVDQHRGTSADPKRQGGPHAHSIGMDPDNRFALSADLGLDRVYVYRVDHDKGTLAPNDPPWAEIAPRSGPRHFVFSHDGRFVYVISEIAVTVTTFAYDAAHGTLQSLATDSTLPKGVAIGNSSGAEIAIRPDGKFLYASNRGNDSIAIFSIDPKSGRLTPVGHQSSGGKTPRSFGIDPTGAFLLAANQDSDNVVVMRIDPQTGKLSPTGESVEIGNPVCVKMIAWPR